MKGSEEFNLYEGLGKKLKAKNFRSASFLRGDVEGERRGPPPCTMGITAVRMAE